MGRPVREDPVGKEEARLAWAEDEDGQDWAVGLGGCVCRAQPWDMLPPRERTGGAARPLHVPHTKGAGPGTLLAALF